MKYVFLAKFNHYFLCVNFDKLEDSKKFNKKFLNFGAFNPQHSRIENSNGKIMLNNSTPNTSAVKSERQELIDYCNFKLPEYEDQYSTELEFLIEFFSGFPILEFREGFPGDHLYVSDSAIRQNNLESASIEIKESLDEFREEHGPDFAWCFWYNSKWNAPKPLLSMGGLKNVGLIMVSPISLVNKIRILHTLRAVF